MNRVSIASMLAGSLLLFSGCRSTVYSAYEKVGIYKRDLLRKRVTAARDQEKAAQEQFKDALTRLKELTGFEGGDLEKNYRHLQSDYDSAVTKVTAVHKRVSAVDTVANDLFAEWESEARQIETATLRQNSLDQLRETRSRYEALIATLRDAERKMDPVLRKFHDYVLVLKHSLNAQAIASLHGESVTIQADISRLLDEMNASIAQADDFVRQMSK